MKWLGCLLIFSGFFYYGYLLSKKYEKNLHMLCEWCQKLLYLQNEIRYAKTPLPEVFERLGAEKKESIVSRFFKTVAGELGKGEGSFEEIWTEQVKGLSAGLGIDYERSCLLGQDLSKMFTNCQAEYMKSYILQLNQYITRSETELAQRQKVTQTLSIAAGMVLVLILW